MDLVVSHEADRDRAPTISKSRKELFLACIGFHEFFLAEMWRAAFTELVATACLIFTLTLSVISCLDSHETDPKLLVPFAVFIIAFLFLMVTVPLSGGHMSPVFTFIAALKGVITLARAAIYVLAQCLGAIISFVIVTSVMNHNDAQKYSYGGCTIGGSSGGKNAGINAPSALVLEFTCTFLVLFVGVTVAFDKRRCKELGLAMVCAIVASAMAIAVFVSITVTGQAGYSGVGLSPARCLGPALLHGGPLWKGHWVFWIGPFVACIVYYGFTKTFPTVGLLRETERPEHDLLDLARACWFGSAISAHVQGRSKDINAHT